MALVVKNPPTNAGDIMRHGFNPWVGKIPWRREWQPIPVFFPGKFSEVRDCFKIMIYCVKDRTTVEGVIFLSCHSFHVKLSTLGSSDWE